MYCFNIMADDHSYTHSMQKFLSFALCLNHILHFVSAHHTKRFGLSFSIFYDHSGNTDVYRLYRRKFMAVINIYLNKSTK